MDSSPATPSPARAAAEPGAAQRPLVLWVTAVSNVAGVGRHFLDTARAGGVPGHRMVYALPEGPLAVALRETGAAVVTGRFGAREQSAVTAVLSLRSLLRRLRPAIVHTHLPYADVIGCAARRGLRAPDGGSIRLVSTEHCISADPDLLQPSHARALLMARVHHVRLRLTDHLIGVAEYTRREVRRQWSRTVPMTVIRNGVDRMHAPRDRATGLRVLSMARLAHEKRIEDVIAVFAALVAREGDARLTIAGEGPERSELERLVAQLGLDGTVRFAGFIDKEQAFREHDVMVQLSAVENLSYSLLEAVAHGIGVIATDVGGNDEILPAHCIVDVADREAAAAAIIDQGLNRDRRPVLDGTIPTVAEMLERVAGVYREVLG
ncbi:glycosyltransferase family 4 protein [Brachybacterium nesterenkovii]|uniref:glycosyltransferase family 4 protein n=1 Tax=Brachybacterium nesterenkovii TaxID=47847 RepID=UPI003218F56F